MEGLEKTIVTTRLMPPMSIQAIRITECRADLVSARSSMPHFDPSCVRSYTLAHEEILVIWSSRDEGVEAGSASARENSLCVVQETVSGLPCGNLLLGFSESRLEVHVVDRPTLASPPIRFGCGALI